jgi:hypothetical protein
MTKQCRKLLPTQAALKNGLDAISRKESSSFSAFYQTRRESPVTFKGGLDDMKAVGGYEICSAMRSGFNGEN